MQSIELKVMGNSIKIDPTGITLQGIMIKINGQAQARSGRRWSRSAAAPWCRSRAITMIG